MQGQAHRFKEISQNQLGKFARIFFKEDIVNPGFMVIIKDLLKGGFLNEKKIIDTLIIADFEHWIQGNHIPYAAIYRRLSQDYPYSAATIKDIVLASAKCS